MRRLASAFGLAMVCAMAVTAGTAAPGVARADMGKQVPLSNSEVTLSFAPVVKKAAPAVVNVYASRTDKVQRNPLFDDPVFRQFFGGGAGADTRSETTRSLGSGVLVDASGLVVTNYHVIDQMTDVKVALSDQSEYPAEIVLRDQRNDLAVLRIKGDGPFPVMELGSSDAVEVGDIALAIGDPFGVGQTVTQGIVSALARTNVGQGVSSFYLQTDASINPGNSGGALVDTHARLVGINSAIFSQSGGSVGIGFAIPVDMVKIVVAAAKAGDKIVHRPWLGASLQAVTQDIAESFGLHRPIGALVTEVADGGPADAAGLKRGDLLTAIDGRIVESPESFGFRFGTKPIGGTTVLTVRRDDKTVQLTMRLVRAPNMPPPDKVVLTGASPFAGITAVNLSPAVAEELSSPESREGVVIVNVAPDTNAAAVSFEKGDMILAVNGKAIKTTKDLVNAVSGQHDYWKLSISRGSDVINTVLNG
jgi:Do/DeqQ family serine protease